MPTGRQAAILGQALWTPAQLGSALVGWWDASFGVTQSATLVSDWADKIGGATASQSSGTLKPVYSDTSLSGQPGLTFDGADDTLVLASVPASFPTGTTDGWIMAAVSQDALAADATTRYPASYGASGANGVRAPRRVIPVATNRASTTDNTTVTNEGTIDYSGAAAQIAIFASGNLSGRINGTTFGPTASAFNTIGTRVRIGAFATTSASGFWQGVIGHVMVGTGTLSTADAERLEAWALWSCGQQAKLPATHTYRNRRP